MRSFAAILLIVIVAMAALRAQSADGVIAGVVHDSTGGTLRGVAVTVTSVDRDTVVGRTDTLDDGSYTVTALAPGTYRVDAALSGFLPQKGAPVVLHIADRVRVDLVLRVEAPSQTVMVEAQSQTELRRDISSLAEIITPEQIRRLPLFARNPVNLLQLVGGVSGGSDADGNLATAQISVNGSRTANTEVTIDGVSAVVGSTGDVTFIPSVEALREFKVQSSAYSAEYGRTSGATVSAAVQSGTSRYRGSVYTYLRDARANANNYFNNSRHIAKPADEFRQFGASLGGPVIKAADTFFFFNYEGLRRTLPRQFTSTLPTADARTGDLSAFGIPILDPLTGQQMRDPSRGTAGNPQGLNIIPLDRLDPAAAAIARLLPLPNQPGLSNNFVSTSEDRVALDQGNLRLEHNFRPGQRLSGRYSQQAGLNAGFTADASQVVPGVLNPGTGPNHPLDRQISVNYTHSVTSRVVFEATLGLNVNRQRLDPPGTIESPSSLGFARAPQLVVDGNSGFYAPAIQFPGFNWGYRNNTAATSQFGLNPNTLRRQNTNTLQPSLASTWVQGRHTVKGGLQLRLNELEIFNGGGSFAGIYSFNGDTLPGAPSNSAATQWAAFMLGRVDSAQYSIPQPDTTRRNRNYAAFAQDDWRLGGRVTINMGLRWEYETPLTIDGNVYSRIDPATGRLLVAGVNASPTLNLEADRFNLAPRIGAAWSVGDRTIIRAAYGLFYSQFFSNLGGAGALYPGFTTNVQYPRVGPGQAQPFTLSQGMPLTGTSGAADPLAAERNSSPGQPLNFGAGWASLTPLPRTHLWNAGVEHDLGDGFIVDASYVGSHGSALPLDSVDFNAVPLERWEEIARAGTAAAIQAARPFPNVATLNEFADIGRSNYLSAQFHLRRLSSHGLGTQASYTLSRSKDDGSGIFNFSQPNGLQRGLIPTFERDLDYGLSAFDRTHVLSAALNYALPWGADSAVPSRGSWMRTILGGFEVNALVSARSGLPATITETGIAALPLSTPRPNQVGPLQTGVTPGPNGSVRYFPAPGDPGFPFQPVGPIYTGSGVSRTQVLPVGLGDVGRNTVRGPAEYNVDMSLVRRFHTGPAANINIRIEAFNVLNHTNFLLDPTGTTTTLPVQVVDGQAQFVAPNFGLITSSLPARRLQLAVRFDF